MWLIALKLLHFAALFFLGNGIMAIHVKSSRHFLSKYIFWKMSNTFLALFSRLGSSTFLLELHPLPRPSHPSILILLIGFSSSALLDLFVFFHLIFFFNQ